MKKRTFKELLEFGSRNPVDRFLVGAFSVVGVLAFLAVGLAAGKTSRNEPVNSPQVAESSAEFQLSGENEKLAEPWLSEKAEKPAEPWLSEEVEKPAENQLPKYIRNNEVVFSSITDIPSVIPADCRAIRFPVKTLISERGTGLHEFSFSGNSYKCTITIPEVERLSDLCEEQNLRVIAVFGEDAINQSVKMVCFAFNPDETPFITINMMDGSSRHPWITMDVPVFSMCFYSESLREDGLYRSSGVSQGNYNSYGGGDSGNDDYLFSPYIIKVDAEIDDWCEPINWSVDSLAEYRDFWQENRSDVMLLRSCFNEARTSFDMETYARSRDVQTSFAENAVILRREDDDELLINNEKQDEHQTIKIYHNGVHVWNAIGYSPRVNGLPEEISLFNNMKLDREELNIILKFIQNVKIPS